MNHTYRLILNAAVKIPVGAALRPFSMSNPIGVHTMVRDAHPTWLGFNHARHSSNASTLQRIRRTAVLAGAVLTALTSGQALAQSGLLLYVPNSADSSVSAYQTNADGSLTAVATISGLGATPRVAAVRGDQAFAYVTIFGSDQVKVIDTSSNTVVQTVATGDGPFGVAVSPDGSRVYVTNNQTGDNVSVFSADASTGQLSALTTINVGARPRAIAISRDGTRAYVANQLPGTVSVIDTATNSVIATVNTGGQLSDVEVNPDGTRAYTVDVTNNKVYVIDTATNAVVANPATGSLPIGVVVSADGSRFYVTNFNGNTITQFDASTNTSLGTVATGDDPGLLAISPDGTSVYVAQGGTSDTVGIFSVSSGLLTANGTIAAGNDPHSVGLCGNGSAMLGSGGTFVANTAGALGCTGSSASFTGGTLKINTASFSSSQAMSLGTGGGTIDTNGNNATISGVISSTGGLTKSGTGTLTLSGANTYSGGTTVNAGTLSGDTSSLQGAITNNATVTFDQAANGTYAGVMGGSGSLTKSGAGILTLSGANTYSGGTTVNAGTLSGTTTSLQGAITNNATVTFDQAANGTYAGAMGGTGSLSKSGTGTLTLSGTNTYNGGTTVSGGLVNFSTLSNLGSGNVTLNGGGLQWATGATTDVSSRLNALGAGGATFDTNGNSVTLASALTGAGALTKSGTGTLSLSGTNTYNGGTTVNAGTLSGTTTSLQGAITNNAAVTFDQAANGTYTGVMGGTGSLSKSGTGTLTLSGTNTYNGGTTVSGGLVNFSALSNFGSGNVTLNGGGLQWATGATTDVSPRLNALGAGGATFDTNGNSATLSGIVGGTGGLVKSGTGTLTLSGANTYSGGTTVNAGTLSGTTTSLQGAITNNATVTFDQTSNGTYAGAISGTGGLTKNGTGKTILSGANTYSGDTNINGGILSVNGSVASNVSVASGGTLGGSGSIGGAVTVADGGIIAPGNSPGILTVNSLTLNPGSITRMEINGLTAGTQYDQIVVNNTATLGGTLDLVFGFTPAGGNRFTLIKAANIVPGFAAIQDNISTNLGAALSVSTISSATAFDLLINQGSFVPFALTHNQRSAASMVDAQYAAWGATGLVNYLDTLSAAQLPTVLGSLSGEQHTHGQSMARRLGTQFNSLLLSRLDAVDAERTHGWNFWLKGLGGFGRVDSDGNAGRADNNSGGFALGADTELNDHALLGAAASYVHSNVDAVTANLGMDSYQLSGYAKWHRDDNYIKGTLGAGFHQTGSRRTVFEDSASANYGSTTAGTALEAGRNVALLEHTTLTPYAGMQYQHLNRNGFTETGSDLANLKVREANEDSFRTLLGARLSQTVKTGWGVSIQPSLHAAWVHEHGDRVSRMAADFAAAPAAVYRVNGPSLDRSRAAVGAGLVTQFSKTAQLNVAYNAELARSDNWHTLSATFEYRW